MSFTLSILTGQRMIKLLGRGLGCDWPCGGGLFWGVLRFGRIESRLCLIFTSLLQIRWCV
jgi:hypothetical protein